MLLNIHIMFFSNPVTIKKAINFLVFSYTKSLSPFVCGWLDRRMNGWLGYVWSEVYKASKSVAKAAVAYNVCFCGGNHCNFIPKILCMHVPAYGISKTKRQLKRERKKQTLKKKQAMKLKNTIDHLGFRASRRSGC